jgi:hypothetical protein
VDPETEPIAQLRRSEVHGGDAREAPAVRGGLAQPEPVGVAGVVKRGAFITFHAKEYRATLQFYWAPFLVESNSDNPNFHSIDQRIISPDRIEAHAINWKGADYLIFNTYIWWMNTADIKVRSVSHPLLL